MCFMDVVIVVRLFRVCLSCGFDMMVWVDDVMVVRLLVMVWKFMFLSCVCRFWMVVVVVGILVIFW